MGCTNCKGKSGCDHRKGAMLAEVDAALAALYPTRTWGEDVPAAPPALGPRELDALADELATALKAATFVRPGGDDEACDFIYALCVGRAPCIAQVRDHGVALPDEWRSLRDGEALHEQYLRVAIAHRAPFAAVQQVALELVRGPAGFAVHERPRAGVYDAPLLPRMQKLVAILPAYELTHLDFGEIAHAPPGYAPGAWAELYGGAPSIASYLFYAPPPTTPSTTYLADAAARRGSEAA